MDILISENLRNFRKAHGNTQEELAEFLTVSPQAVSKWERGEGMPDISILPRIAAYYDVSLDELFGVDEMKKKEKLAEYYRKYDELSEEGLQMEAADLMLEAMKEFPRDVDLGLYRVWALAMINGRDEKLTREMISLCENVLEKSTNQSRRISAIDNLSSAYSDLGDKENAQKYAQMLGTLWSSVEMAMLNILDGEELANHAKWQIINIVQLANVFLGSVMRGENADVDRRIELNKWYLGLFNAIFDDGNCGWFSHHVRSAHLYLASAYAGKGDENNVRTHLEEAAKYTEIYDNLPDDVDAEYTATAIRGYKVSRMSSSRNYTGTLSDGLLKALDNQCYDQFRNRDWFISLCSRFSAKTSK